MPRSPSTYSLPPGTTPQQPNTVISSSMFNAFADDVAQTFNTVQPIVYGGTGSNDLKLTDTDFGIKDNSDPTKIGQFNASGLPTGTTRTYDLPYYSGTLGLVSDIRGQIYGLTLSNNGTDPTNDIDIAAGSAVDNNGVVSMLLASALTKRLDAAWAVGTNQGGLDTGAIANTTYHMYLMRRPDTGVVDVCFSASAVAPTTGGAIPAAYTQFRRIGSIMRESGAIVGFIQLGDKFLRTSMSTYTSATNPGTAPFTVTVGVPTGFNFEAIVQIGSIGNGSGADARGAAYISGAPSVGSQYNFGASNISTPGGNPQYWNELRLNVVTTAQFTMRLAASGAASQVLVNTVGWIDTRGRG